MKCAYRTEQFGAVLLLVAFLCGGVAAPVLHHLSHARPATGTDVPAAHAEEAEASYSELCWLCATSLVSLNGEPEGHGLHDAAESLVVLAPRSHASSPLLLRSIRGPPLA